jgi:pyroglutamyl-peptidase
MDSVNGASDPRSRADGGRRTQAEAGHRKGEVVVLITGFGAFPNAPKNPTADLVRCLPAYQPRLARLGIRLELQILPVVYAEVEARLAELVERTKPDAVLHFGLAGRRKGLSVETRALNRLGVLHPDAARKLAGRFPIVPGGAQSLRARFPAPRINAAFGKAGIVSRLSIDAGDYVCNQVLYLSLAKTTAQVGFIHVPRLARRDQPSGRAAPRPTPAVLVQAALLAILATAQSVRRGF